MKKVKKWFSILFIMILVTLVWFLWILVLNKNQIFTNMLSYTDLAKKQNKILLEKLNQKINIFKLDPNLAQKQISFNLSNDQLVNIYTFNNNTKKFLLNNKLNNDLETINDTNNYYLNLNISSPVEIKIMKFDNVSWDLLDNVRIDNYEFSTWWILNEYWSIQTQTWSYKIFKFDDDFAIFAKSVSNEGLINIDFKNIETWSWVFVNPISMSGSIVFWNISNIIEKWWKYFLKNLDF